MYPGTASGQLAWTMPIAAGRLAKLSWTLHQREVRYVPLVPDIPARAKVKALRDLADRLGLIPPSPGQPTTRDRAGRHLPRVLDWDRLKVMAVSAGAGSTPEARASYLLLLT
jgi:hypothetical protein